MRSLSLESLEGKSSFSSEGPGQNWILKSSGFWLSSGRCALMPSFFSSFLGSCTLQSVKLQPTGFCKGARVASGL